jgi:hypothetical protein
MFQLNRGVLVIAWIVFYSFSFTYGTFYGNKYLMSSHCTTDEKLYLWLSSDGLSWNMFNGGASFTPPSGVLRDPSIFEHTDGYYYVVYTNNNTDPCNFQGNRFGVAKSADLVTWIHVCWVSIAESSFVWAPEWFVDTDGSVHIFVAAKGYWLNNNFWTIYEMHPANSSLTTWSNPIAITGTSLPKMIDPFMVKIGNTYHLWYKNEDTSQTIGYADSNSLTSGYVIQKSGDWAGWGQKEGDYLTQLDDGTWRIYMTAIVGAVYYSDSNDSWATWTAPVLITDDQSALTPSHGTVVKRSDVYSGDFDGDGDVDFCDLSAIVYYWLESCSGPFWCQGRDLNKSGRVDWVDFASFANNWLEGI